MQRRFLAHQFFHRVDGIEAARPEVLVVPCVFTDGDGQPHAIKLDGLLLAGGGEVALLVEDVVKGQEALMLLQQKVPAVEEYRGVKCRFPVFASRGQSDAG